MEKKSLEVMKRFALTFMMVAFLFGFFAIKNVQALVSIDEIEGSDRFETAGLIADKQIYTKAIIVNSNKSIADGLSASGLAGAEQAPILLVNQDSIPQSTMKRLNSVEKVYIIGTEDAISNSVEESLIAMGIETERLGGSDRCSTSMEVAKKIIELKSINKVMIANGYRGEADAISASSIAARDGAPIILTDGGKLDLTELDVDMSQINKYVFGGEQVVSNSIVDKLGAVRLGGKDRFDTNKKIVQYFYGDYSNVFLTKGYNLVDALTVSPISKQKPIILISDGSDKSILKKVKNFTILGGPEKAAVQQAINVVTGNNPKSQGIYFKINDSDLLNITKSELYAQVNKYRKENSKKELTILSRLESLASEWSKLMAKNNTLSHVINGKNSYSTFMQYLDWSDIPNGYDLVQGESIFKAKVPDKYYYTQDDARQISYKMINEWKDDEKSGGVNLLHNGFSNMGFGISYRDDFTVFCTQEFYGVYKP
ncbi:MAG: cell wall-binding repeat-containing protein [Clostridioides sp.]|jgi:putative cell wall-binding protein|nr:cell wall-binding repeat-containing protein [Clostridioides sp.]